jgi:sulfur carrier protein ThiS
MRISVNCKEKEFPEGTKFVEIVKQVLEAKRDEPMIKTIQKKTGKNPLLFTLNGKIVRSEEYASLEIKPGDEIRSVHPFAGG